MSIYPLRFPKIFRYFFPSAVLKKKNNNNTVYLTFDDGPTPEITNFVLNELKKYNAKATFFCLGDKIERYPDILKDVIDAGHLIGNHTYHHFDAWKTSQKDYLKDVINTEAVIDKYTTGKKLFRPPFGHVTPWHIKGLKKLGFQTVLWTSIAGDYKQNLDTDKVVQKLINQTRSGDILVFHDSKKASENLRKILPELLKSLHQKSFNFDSL